MTNKYLDNPYLQALNQARANIYPLNYSVDSETYEAIRDVLNDLEEDFMLIIDRSPAKPTYEYTHVCDNRLSFVRATVVKLMNEGWEMVEGIERELNGAHVAFHEYSQIMRRAK